MLEEDKIIKGFFGEGGFYDDDEDNEDEEDDVTLDIQEEKKEEGKTNNISIGYDDGLEEDEFELTETEKDEVELWKAQVIRNSWFNNGFTAS